ncbi:MAG: ASKHA domain-containing protein, partial [Alphaproteobacteria bacterium]|nr:ASKHA domain-containing protein [Alphaproteobacteria bacterium]
ARIALLNQRARDEIERVITRVEKIETAVEPRFQEHFVAAMGIPHSTASFPSLAGVVTLPEPKTPNAGPAGSDNKRRRRRRGGA